MGRVDNGTGVTTPSTHRVRRLRPFFFFLANLSSVNTRKFWPKKPKMCQVQKNFCHPCPKKKISIARAESLCTSRHFSYLKRNSKTNICHVAILFFGRTCTGLFWYFLGNFLKHSQIQATTTILKLEFRTWSFWPGGLNRGVLIFQLATRWRWWQPKRQKLSCFGLRNPTFFYFF